MLKISQPHGASHTVTLKLEGRIVGPWVAELQQVCEAHMTGDSHVKLDFGDVTFADRGGLALLLCLQTRGVRFLNCSPFLEEELRTAPHERK